MKYLLLFDKRMALIFSIVCFLTGIVSVGLNLDSNKRADQIWKGSQISYHPDPQRYLSAMMESGRWDIELDEVEVEKEGIYQFLDRYEITAILLGKEESVVFKVIKPVPEDLEEIVKIGVGDLLPGYDAELISIDATQVRFQIGDETISVRLYPREID